MLLTLPQDFFLKRIEDVFAKFLELVHTSNGDLKRDLIYYKK